MQFSKIEFSFPALRELEFELRSGVIGPAQACARFVILHLHVRHAGQWLSSPRTTPIKTGGGGVDAQLENLKISLSPKQREKIRTVRNVTDLYRRYFFRGVVLDSHEGLVGWLEERYPLKLRLDFPSPDEMLEIQCEGFRYVTLLLDEEQQFRSYGRHADACAFLLHDFEHAHKFFSDAKSHGGQVRFFRSLRRSLPFFARWSGDPQFQQDLNYLKSDMNSHPVHLTKYLKAVVLSAEIRRTGSRHPPMDDYWIRLFSEWNLPGDVLRSALKINQPLSESQHDLAAVADFFMEGQ